MQIVHLFLNLVRSRTLVSFDFKSLYLYSSTHFPDLHGTFLKSGRWLPAAFQKRSEKFVDQEGELHSLSSKELGKFKKFSVLSSRKANYRHGKRKEQHKKYLYYKINSLLI
jgi:hypothetical protein